MTIAIIGLVASAVLATLLLMLLDAESPWDRIVGESLILGPFLPALLLFGTSVLAIPWRREILIPIFGMALVVVGFLCRSRVRKGWAIEFPSSKERIVTALLGVLTLALVSGYGKFAILSAGAENDFIGIWGVKGRKFFDLGGIDWGFLSAPWVSYTHPDYPILVPLSFTWISILVEKWSEPVIGLVYPMWSLGALLLVRSEFRRIGVRPSLVWVGVVALIPFSFSPWIGLADGPLAVLTLASLLRFARWIEGLSRTDLTVGSIFLGFAMSTKNEGVTLGLAIVMVMALRFWSRERRVLIGMWPALAIGGPWLFLRAVRGLSTDLFAEGSITRVAERLFDWAYLRELGGYLVQYRPGLWVVIALCGVALVVWWRMIPAGGQFILTIVGVQLAFYLGAYFVTPRPLEWHVQWSWERVVTQIGVSFAVVSVAVLLRVIDANGASMGGSLFAFLGTGPEVEQEQPDPDADR